MGGGRWNQVGLIFVMCLGTAILVGMVGFAGATGDQSDGESTLTSAQNSSVSLQAEAGLDRSVGQYETVYLDAGESTSRDGAVVGYDWEITRPDDSTTTPECTACQQPRFVPETPGTYNATVTVTDTDGREASDTLYIEVSQRDPPEAEIDGASSAEPGTTEEFEADGTPGTNPLLSVDWIENSRHQQSAFLDDTDAMSYETELPLPGLYTIGATVVDDSGLSSKAEQEVEVGEEYSHFAVTIDETTAPVEIGETMVVETTVENQGNLSDTQPIALETPDGVVHAETNVTLEPDEQQQITLDWRLCEDFHGEITALSQDDADTTLVEIHGGQCDQETTFAIEEFNAPDNATEGETVETTATVTNTGEDPEEQVVTLADIYDRYTAAGTKSVELQPGETHELSLDWQSRVGEAGTGELTVRTESAERHSSFELHSMAEFGIAFADVELPEDRSDDDLVAAIDVTNAGSASETQSIALETDDLHIDGTDLSLSGTETAEVTLRWEDAAYAGGTHELIASSEDDESAKTVEIPEGEDEESEADGSGGGGGGGGSGPSYERHAQLTDITSSSNPVTPDNSVSVDLDSIDNEIQAYEPRVGSVQYDGTWICDPRNNHCDAWDEDEWDTLDTYTEQASGSNVDTQWHDVPIYIERDGSTEPTFSADDPSRSSEGESGTFTVESRADYESNNEQNFNGDPITTTIDYEIPEEEDDEYEDDDDSAGGSGPIGGGIGGGNDDDSQSDDEPDESDEEDESDDEEDDSRDEQDPCDINPDNPDCTDDEDDDEEDDQGGVDDPCAGTDICITP